MRRHPLGPVTPAHAQPRARTQGAAPNGAEDRMQFLRTLRRARPVGRADGTAFSDPLTTAISCFTGTG